MGDRATRCTVYACTFRVGMSYYKCPLSKRYQYCGSLGKRQRGRLSVGWERTGTTLRSRRRSQTTDQLGLSQKGDLFSSPVRSCSMNLYGKYGCYGWHLYRCAVHNSCRYSRISILLAVDPRLPESTIVFLPVAVIGLTQKKTGGMWMIGASGLESECGLVVWGLGGTI